MERVERDQPIQVLFMNRPHNKEHVTFAKELRKNMTKEENHLWYDCLRLYRQAYHAPFIRQQIIGKYIADFYCPKAKLIIELDGSQHYTEEALLYDEQRTKYFEALGIAVVRYTNLDIHTRFREICDDILFKVTERIKALQE